MNDKPTSVPWKAAEAAGDRFTNEIAQNYLRDRQDKPVWHAEHAAVERYLKHLPDGARVLDVPFGTGRFAPIYLQRGFQVAGCDISQDMLDVARRALGDAFDEMDIRQSGAENLPFAEEAFDCIVCIRFLESIIPMKAVLPTLKEFRRVTKRYAIVRLNNRLADQPPAPYPEEDERMGSRFYLADIGPFIAQSGWSVIDSVVVQMDLDKRGEKRVFLLEAR